MMTLQWLAFGFLLSQASKCFSDVKMNLTTSMLEFKKNGRLSISGGYDKALDGLLGQGDTDCARSNPSQPTVWLVIDLGQLYSLTKIALLSRAYYGRGAQVYVGHNAVSSVGITDYQCGSNVTIPYRAPSTLTDFGCGSTNWVRYVSIRRTRYNDYQGNQYLGVCEVEAHYDASEDPGVSLTRNGIEITALNVTMVDIIKCGSSKGDFGVTWMFPNTTVISNQSKSATIRQTNNSMGYRDLILNPLTSLPPKGHYSCSYTANGMKETKSVFLNFDVDCLLGAWSACSSSCGRGKRTRKVIHNKPGIDCSGSFSEDCAIVSCLLDLTSKNAIATQGPGMLKTYGPSFAIDGDPSYSSSSICSTPGISTNPWLRIDLQSRYTIRKVQVRFYGRNVPGYVTVNIGNSLVNNGTNNAQCGSPFYRGTVLSPSNSFVCSPSLWGRYVILQKTFLSGRSGYMQVCDVQVYHELDAVIVYNGSPVVSGSVFADSDVALPHPVTCGVNPDPTGLNALLNITWKTGNDQIVPLLSSNTKADVVQTEVSNLTSLRIKKAPLNDIKFFCHYWIDKSKKLLEFDLLINVDCGWGAWSSCSGSCGVGNRRRTRDNPVKKHAGKDCEGMADEKCDTQQPPCAPAPVQSYVTSNEGKQPALQCNASQYHLLGIITFQWFKVVNNTTTAVNPNLGTDSEKSIVKGTYVGSFIFTSVRKTDAGEYICKATGDHRQSISSETISLNVTYPPYNVKLGPNLKTHYRKGKTVSFTCSAQANPPPSTYSWKKDGNTISYSNQKWTVTLDYTDSGIYVCLANNSIGLNSSNVLRISVKDPPGPCSILNASSSDGNTIHLTASCPFNGNSTITGYGYQYRSRVEESSNWSANFSRGATQPIAVTGLTPFTRYEVRVRAENAVGLGIYNSSFLQMTAEGNPGPPQSVQAVSTGPYNVSVTWKLPINSYGKIRWYSIYYQAIWPKCLSVTSKEFSETVPSSQLNTTLNEMTPYTRYVIKVAGINVRQIDRTNLTGNQSIEARVLTNETVEPPPAPVNLTWSRVSDNATSVIVKWNAPCPAYGLIRNYIITYQPADGRDPKTVNTGNDATTARLDNLKLQESYNISVQTVTITAGPSAIIQVTPSLESAPSSSSATTAAVVVVILLLVVLAVVVALFILRRRHAANEKESKLTYLTGNQKSFSTLNQVNDDGDGYQDGDLALPSPAISIGGSRCSGSDIDHPSELSMADFSGACQQGDASTRVVSLEHFPDRVAAMHQGKNSGFSDEFKALGKLADGIHLPADACKASRAKNRYKNILTYDRARVVLKALPGMESLESDYVAAAYVDGHSKENKFIASQGPVKKTGADMWRMIWGENVRSIVMLTRLIEGNKIKCYQYWPNEVDSTVEFQRIHVSLRKVEAFADYDIKTIDVTLEDDSRSIKLYHFTSWPDHGVPKFPTRLLNFIRRVNRELPEDAGPILVHCSAGVGRTGTFIVIDQMLEKIQNGVPIDVFSAVASLRTKRQEMVQVVNQYTFIHDALLEAVLCGNTQIPVHSLRSTFMNLCEKDKKGRTRFERQYLMLQTASPHFDKSLCKAGFHASVQKKNRYPEIIPLDSERVVLHLDEASGNEAYVNTAAGANYINASYADSYHRHDAFILTQGPLRNTAEDFWKMVWEQNSFTIVNLTQLQENDLEMCYRYWPESGSAQFSDFNVEIEEEAPSTGYTVRKINLSKSSLTRTVCQFHFTEWPERECPVSANHLLDMILEMEKWQQATGDNIIIVHCNNGIGRSGVFCAVVSAIGAMKMEDVIDVFYNVKALRIKRPGIVQNVDQYKFCYQALLDYMDIFDTYANFK